MTYHGENLGAFRKPHPEGELYDPVGYNKVIGIYLGINVAMALIMICAFISFAVEWNSFSFESISPHGNSKNSSPFEFFIILAIAIGIPLKIYYNFELEKHEKAVAQIKNAKIIDQ